MSLLPNRRNALGALASSPIVTSSSALSFAEGRKVRVRVWDERQKEQKQVYPQFLGKFLTDALARETDLSCVSTGLDDPDQGLAARDLDQTDVLFWWGHVRQAEVDRPTSRGIVQRIKAGKLGLVALHSAHWATPFVEAMNDRAQMDLEKTYTEKSWGKIEGIQRQEPTKRYTVPKHTDRLTPYARQRRFPNGSVQVTLHLPYCCFPDYRSDGKPSRVRVMAREHPIAAGVEGEFTIPRTEMYNEPFHVPEPDLVLLEERWETGEWFRSGMLWRLGLGWVFYFRPGHETFPVFYEPMVLRLMANAARWIGSEVAKFR